MKLASTLVVSLLDKFTGPSGMVGRAMKSLAGASRSLDTSLASSRTKLAGYHSNMLGVAAAGYAAARALAAPVKAAMDFESAMADVKKVVNFETPGSFLKFKADVLMMSTRIPMAADALTKIVAAAGQSGIANKDLLKFTELAAKVGVAFDISADTAGDSLAKMMTALSLSVDDVGKLADAMNYLSNSQASSAADILEFFRRTGSDGKMFGFTAVQTSAFGSAMLSAGAEAEVAATSFRNMGKALAKGGAATKAQRTAFKALGLDATKVAKAMQKDAVGTTVNVLEAINKLPKYQQSAVASQLFGDEARALMPLISNLDLLKKSLGMVASETSYAGSANAEYAARAATFANKLQLFQNKMNGLAVTVGDALIPALSGAIDTIGPLVGVLSDFVAAHPELTRNIVLASAALVGFRIAAFAAGYAVTSLKVAALASAVAVRSVGRAAIFAGTIGLAPFGRALSGLAGVVQIAAMRFRFGATALRSGGSAAGFLAGTFATLGRSLVSVGGIAMRLVGSMLAFSGIGLVAAAAIAAIAAAGVWLYNNLSGIVTFLGSFGEAFMAALGPAKGVIQPVVDAAGRLYDKVASWLGPIDASGEKWKAWGELAGKAVAGWVNAATSFVTNTIDLVTGLPDRVMALAGRMYDAGAALVTGLWDGLKAQIDAMLGWFSAKIDGLATSASSLANKISFGMVGTAAPAATSMPVAGARAAGGPVEFGKIYKVGERGTELFTPGADGTISPNSSYRQATSGGGGRTIHVGGITINLGMVSDGRSIRDVAEDLGQRIRDALDGTFADGTV
ncbi:MAG: phage tail tape measure protein, family, core region [Proteobacteria bacterium]|nr:phage tail tape measure protein, family, core region [Pseudomonadota bacterium]